MTRTFIGIAAVLALAGMTSATAFADNVTVPLTCKGKKPGNTSSYPGPSIQNTSGAEIQEGKRIRWWRTESGIGNSSGEITVKDTIKKDGWISAGDNIGTASCKAEIDKKRADVVIKNVWFPEPGKVKVKMKNVGDWNTSKAQVSVDIFACGSETPAFERKSKEYSLPKGETKTLTFNYTAFAGGKATVEVMADPMAKINEISEWNNRSGNSTCPCGGGQVCGAGEPSCGGGHTCDDGCCEPLPPG